MNDVVPKKADVTDYIGLDRVEVYSMSVRERGSVVPLPAENLRAIQA